MNNDELDRWAEDLSVRFIHRISNIFYLPFKEAMKTCLVCGYWLKELLGKIGKKLHF